ncbi:MAG: MBL fold metallo-hydrolase [Actinomycetota bacterium]|jgi:L-ascorbate metabolism protein UlaG (beta-lactamase superfamily)|nr:MBL fold metallo-hydrolase [Actinomycetota bacterium]
MSARVLRFRPDVAMNVGYDDRTRFGSPIGRRPDTTAHELFAPVVAHLGDHGVDRAVLGGSGLLEQLLEHQPLKDVALSVSASGWELPPELRFPDPARARPRWLTVARPDLDVVTRADLPPDYWAPIHELVSALSGPGLPEDDVEKLSVDLLTMLRGFGDEDLLELTEQGPADWACAEELSGHDLTFVGHNCVVCRSGDTSIVIDPFLPARSTSSPLDYQPLQMADFGSVDAVLITHSHPDHFDPASLLRFPPSTPMIVPAVERETFLCVDMGARLAQLGFDDVLSLGWGESAQVGSLEIVALPFYGEQPTDTVWLHADDQRNLGSTYLVTAPDWSAAFLTDSGRDDAGDARDVAARMRRERGPVDVVFCGYRGWLTYPAQLLFSSVARYFPFVPPDQWGIRQKLMSSIEDAVEVAERWGARVLVPYGDGGAPWHWNLGLGPQLDGDGEENPDFDPFPERVGQAAAYRTRTPSGELIQSPVHCLLLRPCDSVSASGEVVVERVSGHAWPYG